MWYFFFNHYLVATNVYPFLISSLYLQGCFTVECYLFNVVIANDQLNSKTTSQIILTYINNDENRKIDKIDLPYHQPSLVKLTLLCLKLKPLISQQDINLKSCVTRTLYFQLFCFLNSARLPIVLFGLKSILCDCFATHFQSFPNKILSDYISPYQTKHNDISTMFICRSF